MPEPTSPPGWHLKKEIQLGHLITTLTIAATAMLYVAALERRIALVEHQVQQQGARDAAQDAVNRDALAELKSSLLRMEDKLDRALEKMAQRGGR